MAGELRRGFKAESERRALEWRAKLKLRSDAPLDPRRIAGELGVRVVTIADVVAAGLATKTAEYLLNGGQKDFSAVTLVENGRGLIVENEAHPDGRRSNSIAHEVSHLLLKHEPHPPFAKGGTRQWFAPLEAEADWLAGALLVPREAALAVARANLDVERAAETYRVSTQLMKQRLHMTGALTQVSRWGGAARRT
jgi:Zn-dependent peptidase ImmA (M78 family)